MSLVIQNKIKLARIKNGLTQVELGKLLGYPDGQFVSLFERGLSKVPLETLGKICKLLKINVNEVHGRLVTDESIRIWTALKKGFDETKRL